MWCCMHVRSATAASQATFTAVGYIPLGYPQRALCELVCALASLAVNVLLYCFQS